MKEENVMGKAAPYSGPEPFIFISYAHRDREEVFAVITYLYGAGFRLWYDEGIDPGTEWDENIASHVEKCDGFIGFISRRYLESDNCRDELNYARDLGKDRLLIYLEDVRLPSGMAMRLNRLQAIHKYRYGYEEDFYRKLTETPMLRRNRIPVEQTEDEHRDFREERTALHIGRYHFTDAELTGTGFAGKVYKAYDDKQRKYFALKQYRLPDAFHIPLFTRSDLSRQLKELLHPGLCRIFDIYICDEPCVVMDYIEGESLRSYLENHAVDIQRGLEIARDVLLALEELHRHGIYYGDLKPDNVMISREGRVCLCDFSGSNYNGFRFDEVTIIEYKFKSPEKNWENLIDFRSDIYECGMLLDELTLKNIDVSGMPADWGQKGVNRFGCSPEECQILGIIQKAAQKRPEDRYSTAAEMREEIEKLLMERAGAL